MDSQLLSERLGFQEIENETPYATRYDFGDSLLESSLDKQGILFPLLLSQKDGKRGVLVSGHKRFFMARKKGLDKIPVTWAGENFSERELLLLSLYSNWGQRLNELDQMTAIRKAQRDFRFTEESILTEIMPALGLPSSRGILDDYAQVAGLAPEIHQLIQNKNIPFRGASGLSRFSNAEQNLLANVLERVYLTSNQLSKTAEWIFDIKKGKKTTLESVLQKETLKEALENPRTDLRTKGDNFFRAVRFLRFPRLTQEVGKLQKIKSKVEENKDFLLTWPEGLEKKEILVTARLHGRGDLRRVLAFLETNRSFLESPFKD